MVEKYNIAAYARISVDTELNKENTSIEHQKEIISEYCKRAFPFSNVDYFEDRDKSGYSFEQRPGYMKMKGLLLSHNYDILVFKDLSRFSRRTGRGIDEFESLIASGIRIISISDDLDCSKLDRDWNYKKLFFFFNETPVTQTSEKVNAVVALRQSQGKWVCNVPYGYILTNAKKSQYTIDEPAANVVREIFKLYNDDGWGYKKIANYLTDMHIPTPRMCMLQQREAVGEEYKGKVKNAWSIATVSEILNNDFYIGTLRQHKFTRKEINGKDKKLDESEHLVFEKAHEGIIDPKVFAQTQEIIKERSKYNYRGVKKFENTYSGLLFCGDCGSPMFARSHKDGLTNYVCGAYHVRGIKACTSHAIRSDCLDKVVKSFLQRVRNNSTGMIKILEERINSEDEITSGCLNAAEQLEKMIAEEKDMLRTLMRQKSRDIMRPGADVALIGQTYDELVDESQRKINGYENQLVMAVDSRNTTIRANRVAQTAIEIFDEILAKDKLAKKDITLLLDRILVFEQHIKIKLKPYIEELLATGHFAKGDSNFSSDVKDIEKAGETAVLSSKNHKDKVFDVNVISGGDPLEIYTDREGEVIFKKYSPIGELVDFAADYAETLYKTCGVPVAVCDRDAVIACAGVPKKDYLDKKNSTDIEQVIEGRALYVLSEGGEKIAVTDDDKTHYVYCAQPIFAEGDVIGCVVSLAATDVKKDARDAVTETKLIQTAASFLGRQLEM
ncbi:MAG: recombinase family protein [Clostridia bacterium]|nr:recombinase family protein [Clostridia bacterium]